LVSFDSDSYIYIHIISVPKGLFGSNGREGRGGNLMVGRGREGI
jgi:hypothetical protein